jgi:hypothetical protein
MDGTVNFQFVLHYFFISKRTKLANQKSSPALKTPIHNPNWSRAIQGCIIAPMIRKLRNINDKEPDQA